MKRGGQVPPVGPTSNPDMGSCSGGSASPVQRSERRSTRLPMLSRNVTRRELLTIGAATAAAEIAAALLPGSSGGATSPTPPPSVSPRLNRTEDAVHLLQENRALSHQFSRSPGDGAYAPHGPS